MTRAKPVQLDNPRQLFNNSRSMNLVFYFLIAATAIGLLAVAVVMLLRRASEPAGGRGDRAGMLREATRRLQQNPRDAAAHRDLAELAFDDQDWAEAYNHYAALVPLCATSREIDEFAVNLRLGQSALKLGKTEEAYKHLQIARALREGEFEVNHQLGIMEFGRKNYGKATRYFELARRSRPDDVVTNRYLGHCLYNAKDYGQALTVLQRVLDFEPEDKRTQFALARSYLAVKQGEKALPIFTHLRTDPELGALSALHAGTLHLNARCFDEAVADLEIGLRHENLAQPVLLELKYRMAEACLQKGEIPTAIRLWKEIALLQPDYKDARDKIATYQELNTNRNLQTFLLAASSEFIALCRKLSVRYFSNAATKLLNISLQRSEYVDILAQVRASQSEDLTLFRFVRSTGAVGELLLRDFYARIKEVRATRGVCVSAGNYTEQARQFVEARMIDLVDGESLPKLLKRL
jgi:tetratricopeptide (TPR) repeat protein